MAMTESFRKELLDIFDLCEDGDVKLVHLENGKKRITFELTLPPQTGQRTNGRNEEIRGLRNGLEETVYENRTTKQ